MRMMRTSALLLGAGLLLAGCSDDTFVVPDLNNAGLEELANNPNFVTVQLAAQGLGCLVISSELPELLQVQLAGGWGPTWHQVLSAGRPLFTIYLLAIAFGYLGGFWVRGGQTLGMRAWRLRATTADGAPLGWTDALARFAAAALSWLPAGAGFLWIAFDRDRLSLHDRLSGTRLVLEPRRGSPASPPASETGGAEPASGTPPGDPP